MDTNEEIFLLYETVIEKRMNPLPSNVVRFKFVRAQQSKYKIDHGERIEIPSKFPNGEPLMKPILSYEVAVTTDDIDGAAEIHGILYNTLEIYTVDPKCAESLNKRFTGKYVTAKILDGYPKDGEWPRISAILKLSDNQITPSIQYNNQLKSISITPAKPKPPVQDSLPGIWPYDITH